MAEITDDVLTESTEKTTVTDNASTTSMTASTTTTATEEPTKYSKEIHSDAEGTDEASKNAGTAENKESVAEGAPKKKRTDDDEEEKDGDDMFVDKNITIFGEENAIPLDVIVSYIETDDTNLEEEEEEDSFDIYDYFGDLGKIKEHHVEIKEPIDREQIVNSIQGLQEEKIILRKKNNFLHRKLSDYYKKRKIEQVFQDSYTDLYDNLYEKYERKIEELYEEREQWLREKTIIDDKISKMYITKTLNMEYLNKILNNLLTREKEIGALLVDPSNGKKVPEKIYDRLIQRQRLKSAEIAEIRLVYIKQRDKVKEIENKLKCLETIDGTLHLMDFEQLRMENTTYADKIEERDEELMRLRERHSHANSVLAHTREKSNVIVEDIEEKKEDCIRQGYNVSEIRESLNELKIKRDSNRAQAEKLNLNSGLLTYPRLLIDMEESLKLEEELNSQLIDLKTTNKVDRSKLIAIRNAIEQTEHTLFKRSTTNKLVHHEKKYDHSRPTIFKSKLTAIKEI